MIRYFMTIKKNLFFKLFKLFSAYLLHYLNNFLLLLIFGYVIWRKVFSTVVFFCMFWFCCINCRDLSHHFLYTVLDIFCCNYKERKMRNMRDCLDLLFFGFSQPPFPKNLILNLRMDSKVTVWYFDEDLWA